MVDIMAAIKKPFSDKKTMGIGLVLSAIPVVNLLVEGYALKIAQETIKGKNSLIPFAIGDIVEYILNFIKAIVIGIVYMIVPLIVMGIGIGSAAAGILSNASALSNPDVALELVMQNLAVGGPIILIGALLALIAALILPMAMMKWLKAGKVMAAFAVVDVIKNALTADYIIAIVVAVIYSMILTIVLGIIAAVLGLIPVIGFVLVMLVMGLASFATQVTTMSMVAQTVK
ncbi:MAG: DUF4013 domain-containing protein [archaeon]|jgi:hypothetical protein